MTSENKAIVQGFFEAFNEGDLDTAVQVFAPTFLAHYPGYEGPLNRETSRRWAERFHAAFDFESTIEEQVAEGDKVVTREMVRGTHTGPYEGLPTTGNTFTFTSITIDRVENGQIVERWVEWSQLTLLQQLGALPTQE